MASRPVVAREENMRLPRGDIVHVQDFLGMIAERLGRDSAEVVYPEENHDGCHHQHKQGPAGDVELPGSRVIKSFNRDQNVVDFQPVARKPG